MTSPRKKSAFAPATVANVACGFDVLGLAFEAPGDTVTAELNGGGGLELATISGDGERLPRDPARNTATVAVAKLLEKLPSKERPGIRLHLRKGLPLASGMGSSAASAVAALVAVRALLELEVELPELLAAALESERFVSGSAHPDNVAACLYGGFVLVRDVETADVLSLPIPRGLSLALVRPNLELSTKDSRALLGDRVRLTDAVSQWANVGALVSGLYTADWDLIARSLVDSIAEPVRADYVPGFHETKRAALEAGALGCSLSGSGPSIFALTRDRKTAELVSKRMADAMTSSAGGEVDVYVSEVCKRGARLVEGGAQCAT